MNAELDVIFERQVEAIPRLGPCALGELIAELGQRYLIRTGIDDALARYAALDPEAVRVAGADRFPPRPLLVVAKRMKASPGLPPREAFATRVSGI